MKNIIVTGASSGIGYDLVKQLSFDSSNSIIAIARNKEKLAALQQECLKVNPKSNVHIVDFDLFQTIKIPSLIKSITSIAPSTDILINNAGAFIKKPIIELTDTDLEAIYRVNVFSVFALIRELISFFNKTQSHIVNISSIGGIQGSVKFPELSAYSSSKAALIGLTECLAVELKEKNIAVNCLALGAVQTDMLAKAFPDFNANTSSADMAKYIAEFALNGHNYYNGKTLQVSNSTP